MTSAQSHALNEARAPVSENLFGKLANSDPADAIEIAATLPLENRARLAAFCYSRRHLNHLGLLIASTCDRMALRRAMGTAGDVVFKQSRDVEQTISAERGSRNGANKVTLATAANVVPLRASLLNSSEEDDNQMEVE